MYSRTGNLKMMSESHGAPRRSLFVVGIRANTVLRSLTHRMPPLLHERLRVIRLAELDRSVCTRATSC